MVSGDVIKNAVLGITALALILVSLYFFLISISLASAAEPNVTASLLSALIGFSVLSSGVTILRSWAIARAAERAAEQK